jgi:hypothetical protein
MLTPFNSGQCGFERKQIDWDLPVCELSFLLHVHSLKELFPSENESQKRPPVNEHEKHA